MKTTGHITTFLIGLGIFSQLCAAALPCGVAGNFTGYSCPPKEGYESTITGLSEVGNSYKCLYRSGSSGESNSFVTKQQKCTPVSSQPDAPLQAMAADIANEMTIRINDGRTFPSSIYDVSGIESGMNAWIQNVRTSGGGGAITHGLSFKQLDSHTNYESTVPSILVGILTLDTEYFNKGPNGVTYINSTGDVDINPNLISSSTRGSTIIGDTMDSMANGVKSVINSVAGTNLSTNTNSSTSTFNPLDFMDKQVLGFYVYLTANLIAGYMDIIYLVFMLGTMWAFGVYGYKKYLDKTMGSNEFNVNKMSYLMTAAMGFAFFTAPIIHEEVDKSGSMARVIYNDNNGHNTGDYYGYSTMAQETIRYAAQLGTYFANLESDYAMKAFYAFLEFKQGMFTSPQDTGHRFSEKARKIQKNVFQASMHANFVNKICRPYFNVPTGSFNFDPQTASTKATVAPENGKALIQAQGIIGADRISWDECQRAYTQMGHEADQILTQTSKLKKEMDAYMDVYVGGNGVDSSNKQNMFKDFLNMMTWTQNNFGWLSSVTPHSAYMFFKHIAVFEDNIDEDEMANSFRTALDDHVESEGGTHSGLINKTGQAIEGTAQMASDFIIGNSVWFMVPGFEGTYRFFEKFFQGITLRGQTGNPTPTGDTMTNPAGIASFLIDKLIPGPVADLVSKSLDVLGAALTKIDKGSDKDPAKANTNTYQALQLMIPIASFIIAMIVIQTMIATVSILIVTIFVIFNAIMYFIELIIFFISAPIIGIYATAIGKGAGQYLENFFKHLGMLLITPLMIVTSSYIVLPITELFKSLFLALVTLSFRLFDKGDDLLNQDAALTNVYDSGKKIIALSAMGGAAEIFAMISVIFISYIIIFNFKDWFAKIIGLDHVAGVTKEAVGELKSSSNKYISPF